MRKLTIFLLLVLIFPIGLKGAWEKCNSPKTGGFNDIVKYGDVYLGATNYGTAISTDNGNRWEIQDNPLKGRNVYRILTSDSLVYYLSDGPFYISSDLGKNLKTLYKNDLDYNIDPNFNYCNNQDTIFYKKDNKLYMYFDDFKRKFEDFDKIFQGRTIEQIFKFKSGLLIKTIHGYYKTNGYNNNTTYLEELDDFPEFKFFVHNDSLVYFANDTSLYVTDLKFSYYKKIDSLSQYADSISYYNDKFIDLVMTDFGLVASTLMGGINKYDHNHQKELIDLIRYFPNNEYHLFYIEGNLFATNHQEYYYDSYLLDLRNNKVKKIGYSEIDYWQNSYIRNNRIWNEFYGLLYYSEDFGLNWECFDYKIRNIQSFEILDSIILVNTSTYPNRLGTALFKSTNYGKSWDSIYLEDYLVGYDMLFVGGDLFAIGDYGIVLSKDTGKTWQEVVFSTYPNFLIKIDNYLFAYGYFYIMRLNLGDFKDYKKLDYFHNDGAGIFKVGSKTIFYNYYKSLPWYYISTNYGDNSIRIDSKIKISDLTIHDNNEVKFDLINSTLMFTLDNGNSWVNLFQEFEEIDEIIIIKDYIIIRKEDGIFRKKLSEFPVTDVVVHQSINDKIIYPNPATDYITIDLEGINRRVNPTVEGNVSVEIYDVMGVRIHSTPSASQPPLNEGNLKIDISNLSPGVYFVKIVGSIGACSIVEKFVKY